MRVNGYDPFRFERPEPEPVDGLLPPPIALVEDEEIPRSPRWRFWLAAVLVTLLALDLTAHLLQLLGRDDDAPAPATRPVMLTP